MYICHMYVLKCVFMHACTQEHIIHIYLYVYTQISKYVLSIGIFSAVQKNPHISVFGNLSQNDS